MYMTVTYISMQKGTQLNFQIVYTFTYVTNKAYENKEWISPVYIIFCAHQINTFGRVNTCTCSCAC